ncbi:hypothetical protein SESBI_35487, partial [Sesbania bispinosa]
QNFEVTEEHKNFVLSLAGRDARGFRSRLRKKYLMDEDGNLILQPPKKYARLSTVTDYWIDFANQSSTEDFKKESAENAERARGMTMRYRKSAKGYAQLEQDMRATRVNKNGIIDDEEVQRVADECVKLTQTFPQEQLQAMGKDDILSKALGVPENPGRVRAAGFGVSQRSVFGPSQSTPQQQWTDWQLRAQQWMLQMSQWATQVSGGQSHPHEDSPPQPQQNIQPQSQKGSCTPIASLEIPEGDHPCFLLLNSPHRHVARGTVYNNGGVTLHTLSLPPGHHKVSVDVVQSHEEDSPLPIPIEDENLMTLRDAIGKRKEHFQTKEFVTSPMKGSVHRIIPEEFAGPEGILAFKNLRIMVQSDVLVHVVENTYSKNYWGKEFKDEIGTNEIIEVTSHRLLSGSSLYFYI